MSRRALLEFLLGGGMAALIPTTPSPAQESGSLERAVKATYLWKFAPFIEWPAVRLQIAGQPFCYLPPRQQSIREFARRSGGWPAYPRTADIDTTSFDGEWELRLPDFV